MFDNKSITDVPLTMGETELMKVMEIENGDKTGQLGRKHRKGVGKQAVSKKQLNLQETESNVRSIDL